MATAPRGVDYLYLYLYYNTIVKKVNSVLSTHHSFIYKFEPFALFNDRASGFLRERRRLKVSKAIAPEFSTSINTKFLARH